MLIDLTSRTATVALHTLLICLIATLASCALNEPESPVADDSKSSQAQQDDWLLAEKNCHIPEHQSDYTGPQYHSLWDRLRAGYKLNNSQHKTVDVYVKSYLRHPGYLPRVTERAAPFLHYIVEELEKRDMPLELALLPVVESAFDPFAYSHGRAAGMWQFIPGTGKQYGLKQNWWYDGRRDFVASTEAALNYLSDLHRRLDGDWLLALAAYNSGAGNVRKAIRRNTQQGKGTDFWSLKLPRETRAYVPQLLAISQIVMNPDEYDVTLQPIDNKPFLAIVETGSQIDLAQAASMAELNIKELYQFNAGFNRWATDPKGPHRLVVPIDHAELLQSNLASDDGQRVSWERYKVRSGDSLISIARGFNTTVDVIRENNAIKGNIIRTGQMLLIPTASHDAQHYVQSQNQRLLRTQARASGAVAGSKKLDYRVKAGDSLWTIARRHKVKVSQLAKWNGMAPRDTLKQNQKLVIWVATPTTASLDSDRPVGEPVIRKVAYTVRRGDSVARIAGKFNVGVKDVLRWNTLKASSYIQPGQLLTLYVDVTRTLR